MSLEMFQQCLSESPQALLDFLAEQTEAESRQFSKEAQSWYKDLHADWQGEVRGQNRDIISLTAPAAVLAVCTLSEVKKLKCWGRDLRWTELALQRRTPEWRQRWADWLVETAPSRWPDARELARRGLIEKSSAPSYILGMILAAYRGEGAPELLKNDPSLLTDVPFLFQVEGGGETSLAAVDKYLSVERQWSTALRELSQEGELSRKDLLTWSLEALNRDFSTFRAGWFSRFFASLKPNLKELEERLTLLYPLLRSTVSPTVSFALKHLNKCKKLSILELLEQLPYLWVSSKKGQIKQGVKLLRKHASAEEQWDSLLAVVEHPDPDIQILALETLRSLVERPNATQMESLKSRCGDLSASVRQQWSSWLELDFPQALGAVDDEPVAELACPEESGELHRLENEEEVAELSRALIESVEDPWDIEALIDGVLRLACTDNSRHSSLRKRALKRLGAEPLTAGLSAVVLAWMGEETSWRPAQEIQIAKNSGWPTKLLRRLPAWSGGSKESIDALTLENVLLNRLHEVVKFLGQGLSDPQGSMSWPHSRAGLIVETKPLEDTGRANSRPIDFAQALLRLERGSTFQLDKKAPSLWTQAQQIRDSELDWTYHIETKTHTVSGKTYTHRFFRLQCEDQLFDWSPQIGETAGSRRWQSLVCPTRSQRWFLEGLHQIANNIDWWQVQWADFVFLEVLAEQSQSWGREEVLLASFGLGCKESTQMGLAVDAVGGALARGLLRPEDLGDALAEAAKSGMIKANRWSKAFQRLMEFSDGAQLFGVLEQLFSQLPENWNASPLLGVFVELQANSKRPLSSRKARAHLQDIKGKGKAAKLARRLLTYS